MAAISLAIFQFGIRGGVRISMEKGHVRTFKGEEYQTVMSIETKGTDWIGSLPTTFTIATGQLVNVEPIEEGKVRLRFLGKYAGRTQGLTVGISLTDPLKLMQRLEQLVQSEFILDTLPLSLLTPVVPRKVTIFGFGDQTTGYPGPGQELYGLDEYHFAGDTKDIIWKRVAKSPDETLVARVREANVKDVVRVGVIQFAERGDQRGEWVDKLCEALGYIGKEVLGMGSSFMVLYHSPGGAGPLDRIEEERSLGLTQARAKDLKEVAEAVMGCSVVSGSKDIETVVGNSDFVITGLRELADQKTAAVMAERPMLLIQEEASPPSTFGDRSVIYTGKENLFPLIRKMLER